MPCAQIKVSANIPENKKKEIVNAGANVLAKSIGKPISYCMCTLEQLAAGSMGGNADAPVAFIHVSSIGGLGGSTNEKISKGFADLLKSELGIDGGRVYLNFENVSGSNWGHNGGTF